ncbi:putative enzyme related to lactoylglutathione lyase [Symbiobacterium terraclitae]|uniref:Enzyme related to lactoylglutathione lyase n=1 Tax=Symbiobacterium terraclitae TaxID=557451 RepID=A0ABS4JPV3_9FIRM|nr:VOC family protein [Symbiobacterium terraclitae]MBP2017577.1 putative enzyme related to lactoylglutathione lyase [Symbiobacterium terraclitae]
MSADIAVPEHEKEMRFYSRVLSTGERPLWRAEDLMNNLGLPIIGLGRRAPEYESLPLQWMPHIQVADVGSSVARAAELGGKVLMHMKDDSGRSQWGVVLDPNGAAFGLIPVIPAEAVPPAADEDGPVGCIAWLDLTVPNADATRDFYKEVVGWSVQEILMKDGDEPYADYAMLGSDGKGAAGICHARGANADLPPVWMLYLPVGDFEESLRRIEEEGGKVVKAVRGEFTYAVIQDPVGVYLALVPG